MMLVKTYLATSKVQGTGLFAAEDIPKGTLVWQFVPGFDVIISKSDFVLLPDIAKDFLAHFGYYNADEGGYILCVDDARFFNHSDDANTDNTQEIGTVASRDIKKGEEITCNYAEFDEEIGIKLR